MRSYYFDTPGEDEVVLVEAQIIDKYDFLLGVDTAATHTTIDSNALYLSGYDIRACLRVSQLVQNASLGNQSEKHK